MKGYLRYRFFDKILSKTCWDTLYNAGQEHIPHLVPYSKLDFNYFANNPFVYCLSNYLRISIFIAIIMNLTLLIKIINRFMLRWKGNRNSTPTSIRNWKVWKRARNVGNRHQAQINQGCKKKSNFNVKDE